jgi:tRNA(Arg) A34 adenosine deaminase TadA
MLPPGEHTSPAPNPGSSLNSHEATTPPQNQLDYMLSTLAPDEREEVHRTFLEVEQYLEATREIFKPGQDEFFSRLALENALASAKEGNYGIGAVAVQKTSAGDLLIYNGRNGVVTSTEQTQALFGPELDLARTLVGHAETLALMRSIHTGITPDLFIPASDVAPDDLANIRTGVSVFGTLEACPMCTCVMTNDKRVVRSVSASKDAPSAHSLGDAAREHQPPVWTDIQDGRGFHPELLSSSDELLPELSKRIFSGTRKAIDQFLSTQDGHR